MEGLKYVSISGVKTHELPPLLVRQEAFCSQEELASRLNLAQIEAEQMLPADDVDSGIIENRKFNIAVQLADQYRQLCSHWRWGDSVLKWVEQCETTFECEEALRTLLHPDVWPHASRSSFVTLLEEKHVISPYIALQKAVGLRLTFRQPPPIDCLTSQYLLYLNSTVANNAYQVWSQLAPPTSLLPPDRFHLEVFSL